MWEETSTTTTTTLSKCHTFRRGGCAHRTYIGICIESVEDFLAVLGVMILSFGKII